MTWQDGTTKGSPIEWHLPPEIDDCDAQQARRNLEARQAKEKRKKYRSPIYRLHF